MAASPIDTSASAGLEKLKLVKRRGSTECLSSHFNKPGNSNILHRFYTLFTCNYYNYSMHYTVKRVLPVLLLALVISANPAVDAVSCSLLAPPHETGPLRKTLSETPGMSDDILHEALNCILQIKRSRTPKDIDALYTPEWTFIRLDKNKPKHFTVFDNSTMKKVEIPIIDNDPEDKKQHIKKVIFHPAGFLLMPSMEYSFLRGLYIYDLKAKKMHKFFIDGVDLLNSGKYFISPDRSYFVFLPDKDGKKNRILRPNIGVHKQSGI